MVAQDVVDWVKNAKRSGSTEDDIRSLLAERGYGKRAIEETLRLAKTSSIGSVKFGIPLVILFIVALLFLSYAFNVLVEGIFVGIIFGLVLYLRYLKRKFVNLLILISSVIGCGFIFIQAYDKSILALSIAIALLISILAFIRYKKDLLLLYSIALSYIFLHLSLDFAGYVVPIIVVVISVISSILYKKEKFDLLRMLLGLSIISFLALELQVSFLFICILLGLVVLHSLFYYFKANKSFDFRSIFLIFLMSLIFSLTITFLLYLVCAYGIFSFIGIMSAVNLNFILFPLVVVFIVSYLIISITLLTKQNQFDYFAYFRFKQFSFLNIFSSRQSVKKSIIKLTFIISFLVLVVSLSFSVMIAINKVEHYYEGMYDYQEEFIHEKIYSFDRYEDIVAKKGFDEIDSSPIVKREGEFFYSFDDGSIDTMFFNCDIILTCQNTSFTSVDLENHMPSHNGLIIAEKGRETFLFLLPAESYEEKISHGLFEFEEGLKETTLSNELDTRLQNIYKAIKDYKIPSPNTWQKKFLLFYTGELYQEDYGILIVESRINISWIKDSREIALLEYKWIENSTPFYDGTETLQEHKQKLTSNVRTMYPRLSSPNIKNWSDAPILDIFYTPDSLFEKATNKIGRHFFSYNILKEKDKEMLEIRKKNPLQNIQLHYEKLAFDESEISKIVRLKILETKIADELIGECETEKCTNEIVSLTKNPRHCGYSDSLKRDKCRVKYSGYDNKYCRFVENESLQKEC